MVGYYSNSLSYFFFFFQGMVRQLLMLSLDDSNGKIRTAVGMAIASIGQYDWPEEWPELLPFLLKLINDQSNQNGGKTNDFLKCC
jgi:hypothetical protein